METNEPTIETRPEQPYVAIRRRVTMQTMSEIADRIPEVFGWLGARGIEPAGAPFLRYRVIDMMRELEVEAGVPLATVVPGDGPVAADVLPAGRYVTVTHVGHPDELLGVTDALLKWADTHGLAWDMTETPAGQQWGCRVEEFQTDPREEPDPNRWVTRLAFRLA